MSFVLFKELSPEACVFSAECFFFVLRLCLIFTFQSDFIYYAINCFWICAVKVRYAKLRNYLKLRNKIQMQAVEDVFMGRVGKDCGLQSENKRDTSTKHSVALSVVYSP